MLAEVKIDFWRDMVGVYQGSPVLFMHTSGSVRSDISLRVTSRASPANHTHTRLRCINYLRINILNPVTF